MHVLQRSLRGLPGEVGILILYTKRLIDKGKPFNALCLPLGIVESENKIKNAQAQLLCHDLENLSTAKGVKGGFNINLIPRNA